MLFPNLQPRRAPLPTGIDLRRAKIEDVLPEVRGARLVVADPPWSYANAPGSANPSEHGIYHTLPMPEVVAHLDRSFDCTGQSARLAVWYTYPTMGEWLATGGAGSRWGPIKTGGAWVKMAPTVDGARRVYQPVGYHWLGAAEPVAIFTKGSCGRRNEDLDNAHVAPPAEHSVKPIDWMRAWIRAWTDPGDLVLDLYAGLGSVAIACHLEGRRYVGAEVDEERHRKATIAISEAI